MVPIDKLHFPVVLITGPTRNQELTRRERLICNREELGTMRVELYSALSDTTNAPPPIVIDSDASVFEMRNIKGRHGGLWMMANPTSMMPIDFELVRRKDDGTLAAGAPTADCSQPASEAAQVKAANGEANRGQ